MDKKRPIGVFDSGVGGLTVLKELKNKLPNEQFIYLADTKNNPYGDKSSEEIIRFTINNINFMLEKNVKAIVIACNTASAFFIESIKNSYDIPILTILESAIEYVDDKHKNILVAATKATIKSKSYEKNINKKNNNLNVYSEPCSDIVPHIESDDLKKEEIQYIVDKHILKYRDKNLDLLILGCTHFPIWKKYFENSLENKSIIFDPAYIISNKLKDILSSKKLLNTIGEVDDIFYVTDKKNKFIENVNKLFPDILISKIYKTNI